MDKNLRDRGRKKWTAMMLPEHVELLRDWMAEDDYTERPSFEDWELELIQEELERGAASKNIVRIHVWKEGGITAYQGVIVDQDFKLRRIYLQDPFCIERLNVDEIIKVEHITSY